MKKEKIIQTGKRLAPMFPAVFVAACVMGSLHGYEPLIYEPKKVEAQVIQQDAVPVITADAEEKEEAAVETVQTKGSFDLADGIYQGSGTGFRGDITVSVQIKDKQITGIDILSSSDDETFFKRAKGVIDAIMKGQTLEVDTISGATYSSRGILYAVKNALTGEKDQATAGVSQEGGNTAAPTPLETVQEPAAYQDGTYYGSGTGFAGNLKVEVQIQEGKIAAIQIVETKDGAEYVQKAAGVIDRIVATQSTNQIDTVSGATFSSNGIIAAVRNALAQAAINGSTAEEITENPSKDQEETDLIQGTLPYLEGVYYGTAEGYQSDIKVAIVLQDQTLRAVLVLEEEDDEAFFTRAMDVIRQMMKKQSTEVDTVSGATYSSQGLIQAVENALKEAERITAGIEEPEDTVIVWNTVQVEAAIDEVNQLQGSQYTVTSWNTVKEQLKNARAVLKNPGSQDNLDQAAAALERALANLEISDGSEQEPEPDVKPDTIYKDGSYPVSILCCPDADFDFEAYHLFLEVTIREDNIVGITNVRGDGDSSNDTYINRAVNGTKSSPGVVTQIIAAGNLEGIDTVSRATCTSQAILDACQMALDSAKQ